LFGKSPVLIQANPTPLDGPSGSEYFASGSNLHPDHLPTNIPKLRGTGLGLKDHSQSSLDTPPTSGSTSGATFPRSNGSLFGFTANEREIIKDTPEISPSLSTSSKNDLFFSSPNPNLPTPPRAFVNSASLGRGWPSSLHDKEQHRAASLPTSTPTKASHSRSTSTQLNPLHGTSSAIRTNSPLGSRLFSDQLPSTPLSSYPTFPKIASTPTPPRPRPANHQRRESQISREYREAPLDSSASPLVPGEVLQPVFDPDLPSFASLGRQWRLSKKLGEGAFSVVWRGESILSDSARCVAIKLTSKSTTRQNARTRIAFLRECSVLRHISHPNVVSFVEAFSTIGYCVLVIEELRGGELWELVGDLGNRKRMTLRDPSEMEGVDGVGEGFVRRIIGELCRAVGWLHRVGIVHRDIKLESKPLPFSTHSPLLIQVQIYYLQQIHSPYLPLRQAPSPSTSYPNH
jgi:hypothetical protein